MVLVHLYYQKVQFGAVLGNIVGSYTRFAAGGFIFISGMSIGMIFLPRAQDPERRMDTYIGLWRRALYILGIQYINALGQMLLAEWEGNGGVYYSVWHVLRNVLFMREGGDLLPFYIIMIALSPFLLELLRRKWGWAVIASASLTAFIYGLSHPWALSLAAAQNFPPILWQAIFVCGIIFASIFRKYDGLATRWKIAAAGVAWSATAVLFYAEYASSFGLPFLNLHMSFVKVPLSLGEALRYLTMIFGIIVVTDMMWRRLLASSPFAEFVQTLGARAWRFMSAICGWLKAWRCWRHTGGGWEHGRSCCRWRRCSSCGSSPSCWICARPPHVCGRRALRLRAIIKLPL